MKHKTKYSLAVFGNSFWTICICSKEILREILIIFDTQTLNNWETLLKVSVSILIAFLSIIEKNNNFKTELDAGKSFKSNIK